ncbi:hypothetical protein MKW92_019386, partial [Papaver armeniacum]
MLSAPNQTFCRPPVRPWSLGSASIPPTTRPPTVIPQGRWERFQEVRPAAPTSSSLGSFRCHGFGGWGHLRRDCLKEPSTGLAQQGA